MIFKNSSLKALSAVAALSFAVSAAPTIAEANTGTTRVSGPGRVETATAAGLHQRAKADTVIIATASDWPDAIASTALANSQDAPLLLTDQKQLPKATIDAIRKLKPSKAIVLGGAKAVSDRVISQLRDLKVQAERVAGAGRAETAAQIALKAGVGGSGQIVIAPGWGEKAWTNAIAASALGASNDKVPTLLVNGDSVPAATTQAIQQLKPTTAVIVGNTATVSDSVMEQLKAMGIRTTRVSGNNQYEISAKVLSQNWDIFQSTSKVVYASGESFADGLAAGALAAHLDAPMVLVPKDQLGSLTTSLLRNWNSPIESGVIVGGTAATSAKVESQINEVLNEGVSTGEQSQAKISDDEYQAMLAEIDVNKAPTPGNAVKRPTQDAPSESPSDSGSSSGDDLMSGASVLSVETGKASYYTDTRVAAPGEKFDGSALAAAHKTLPFGSLVRVTNEKNGKQVVVRINDRGPYIAGRVIDLTHAAAKEIDMMKSGVVPVKLEVLRRGY